MSLGFMYFGPGGASSDKEATKHPPPNEGIPAWIYLMSLTGDKVPAMADLAATAVGVGGGSGLMLLAENFAMWVSKVKPTRQVALDSARLVASNLVHRWFWGKSGEDQAYVSALPLFLAAADKGLKLPAAGRVDLVSPKRTIKPTQTYGSGKETLAYKEGAPGASHAATLSVLGVALAAGIGWVAYAKLTGRPVVFWRR